MSHHVPNLYGTPIRDPHEHKRNSASMGEVNQSVSSRNCERGSEKGTKQGRKPLALVTNVEGKESSAGLINIPAYVKGA